MRAEPLIWSPSRVQSTPVGGNDLQRTLERVTIRSRKRQGKPVHPEEGSEQQASGSRVRAKRAPVTPRNNGILWGLAGRSALGFLLQLGGFPFNHAVSGLRPASLQTRYNGSFEPTAWETSLQRRIRRGWRWEASAGKVEQES